MIGRDGRGFSAVRLIEFFVLLCLGLGQAHVGLGQNPSPTSGLALTNLSATSASLSLVGISNRVIVIQSSSDLTSWIFLGTTQLNASGRGQFIDSGADVSRRFYRGFDDLSGAYSSNSVGFTRLAVPPGFDFVGNPFLSTNTIATLLPNVPSGIVLMKMGATGYVANNFLNGWSIPGMKLLPGEGLFVNNAPAPGITMNFFGEVVQGSSNVLPAGLMLVTSVLPRSGLLQSQLQFPAADGDEVYIFNAARGAYDDPYGFSGDTGWSPAEPSISAGQAFWCIKSTAADWMQTSGAIATYRIVQSAPTSSVAQVNFFTYNRTSGFGRVFRADGITPLGSNFRAQLYAGTNSAESSLVKIGAPVAFQSGTGAGYIRSGIVGINAAVPGQTVYLQLRAWDSAGAANYEAALDAGRARGKSATFNVIAGGGISYYPSEANNFPSFSLDEAPVITTQPASATVLAGSTAQLTVIVSGTPPLVYQWYKGATTIPGATNSVYTMSPVGAAHAGSYFVRISNSVGSVTSVVATLTVRFPPTITQQPQSQSVFVTSNVNFSVIASGDAPLAYQWYFANIPILHETNATLNLINVQPGQAGDYYVVINNAFGLITSAVAALTVSSCSPAPAGLVASWKGEDNAFDSAGNDHGALSNGTTFASGKVGQAFRFDGINDYIEVSSSPALQPTNAISIEAWINLNEIRSFPGEFIISKGTNANMPVDWALSVFDGYLGPQIMRGSTWHVFHGSTLLSTGVWYHVAMVYDGARLSAYVNGQLDGSQTGTGAIQKSGYSLRIGAYAPMAPGASGFFSGGIDELAIYNRALTSNEISAIYAAGSLGKCVPAPFPGAPVMLVNGQPVLNTVTQVNSATIAMQTPVPNGAIYFTLDGSDPANFTDALLYTGPLILNQSATIRAVAYSTDFTSGVEADPVIVVIAHSPSILVQPQNQTVGSGAVAQFSVIATGDGPLRYQWQRNGVAIPGATGATLVLSNVQLSAAGNYLVVVTNLYGSATSSFATLTVIQSPGISVPPANVTTQENARVVFCVDATGDPPLRFQWRKNGVNIPGATNQCYTNASVQIGDGGLYSAAIANAIDTIESAPARLTIPMPVTPGADAFANRISIFDPCFSGNNIGATSESGEPRHANKPGGKSMWYKWIPRTNGIATFETTGSSFDTLLAVYTGTNVAGLTLVAADEDRGGFLNSVVRFNAETNKQYAIAVDGYAGAEGTYTICWRVDAAPTPLPVIVQQPLSVTVLSNQPNMFSVVATSSAPRITYQWFFNGRPLTNETNATLYIPAVRPQHVGFYWAGVSNSGVGLLSDVAVLEIGPFANVQSVAKLPDLFFLQTNSPPSGGMALRAIAAADSSGAGISVGAGSIDSQIINNTGTAGGSNPAPCRVLGGPTRYLLFLATNTATMRVDTGGSTIDTVLGLLVGTSPGTAVPSMCNDDAPGVTTSLLQFGVTPGNAYYIQADGKSGAQGAIFINWTVGVAPNSSQIPTNYVVFQGERIELTNTANATPSPSVQWYHNTVPIPNATTRSLILSNIQPFDGGTYSVTTSNTLGAVTNAIATVTVQSNALLVVQDTFTGTHLTWSSSNSASLQYPATGGNPGGYLSNRVTQGAWRLFVPPEYSGNKFHCYDGLLSFDIRLLTGSLLSDLELSLEGRNLRLVLELSPNPVTSSWTRYHVLLSESAAGWRWYNPTNFGTPITRGQMVFVLSTLTNITITGEFDSTGGSVGIDNVVLLAPTTLLLWVRPDGGDWLVEWPWAIGNYDVESVTNFSEQGWTVLADPLTVNGSLNSIRLPSNTQQFFRLRKHP